MATTSGGIETAHRDPAAAAWQIRANSELRTWAVLAIASLAIAGVFALMLAVSRIPGIETIISWPVDFFAKGLVIHVVFSLVVWLLTMFALLVSLATHEHANGDSLNFAVLGRIGMRCAVCAFPLLFMPAFLDGSEASLNNYIPVIVHPYFYIGLFVFAIGVLLPVVRLFLNLRSGWTRSEPLTLAMTAGGISYLIALLCIALALTQIWGAAPTRAFHADLFWGGGHILQFMNCLMMLAGWFILLRNSLGEDALDGDLFRMAIGLLVLFALPAPLIYLAFDPYSMVQQEAFRRLLFVLGFPTLIVALSGVSAILKKRRSQQPLPWNNSAFVAVVLSVVVFATGGLMGLMISGSDTRTPAHYHGVIAAVNLALMGLIVCHLLPAISRPIKSSKAFRAQLLLFGFGQLVACIGLFLAGGYGAPRKAPAGEFVLLDGATIGLYLNGFGAFFAVIGGVLFIITVARALNADAVPAVSDQ